MYNLPNLYYTFIFNLRVFGLRKGLQFPAYLYGRVKILNKGRIELTAPIRRGMLRIGMHHDNTALPYTILDNRGVIRIEGRTWFHHGCKITNQGTMTFHGNDIISHNTVFDITDTLEMGRNVSVGYSSEFIDTDSHFLIDVETRQVKRNHRPIKIGDFNWFGSHTYVKKGTITPAYTIVASPCALLCRDYTSQIEPYSILGGNPARVIGKGKRRIYNFRNEQMVREQTELHSDGVFTLEDGIDLDKFCEL